MDEKTLLEKGFRLFFHSTVWISTFHSSIQLGIWLMSSVLVAVLAGLMAIFATVSIERFGGKIGGLLGSLPTTIVPASYGFFWNSDNEIAIAASLAVVPIGMLINAIFLYSWRVVPLNLPNTWSLHRRLALMTITSLGIWALSAVFFISIMSILPDNYTIFAGMLGQFTLLGFGIWACKDGVPAPKGTQPVSIPIHLSRGLLSGCAVGGSALISTLGFPILAGMASVFPAMFLTSMLSVWLAQGEAVQAGAVGPMMLGSSSVGVYGLLCIITFPILGPILGSVFAWCGAIILISVPAWLWLRSN